MTNEELQQALRELEERIFDMEIDLSPPEDAMSNFAVFESAAGDRQMIVHFIDVEDYSIELPTNREEARNVFLKVIKEHENHQNREIAHGDLMVLNCQPCNYYCYVAKVDKIAGTGFQAEDRLDPPAAVTDKRENRILHELVIWTETYPNEGGSAVLSSSVIDITSGDTNSFKVTEFTLTETPCGEDAEPYEQDIDYPAGTEVTFEGEVYRASIDISTNIPPVGGVFSSAAWVEACPQEQTFTIPKISVNYSPDPETDANFKTRSFEVTITPGEVKTLDIYKPTKVITDQPCDAIVTTIYPSEYNLSNNYAVGDYTQYQGNYYKSLIANDADPPDGVFGAETWEQVTVDDLPTDSQDPCTFATQKISIRKEFEEESEFKAYDMHVTPGQDTPSGDPFQIGTVSVTGGNNGTAKPFTMHDITLTPCEPEPPDLWDINTLYAEGDYIQYQGNYYKSLIANDADPPDGVFGAETWASATEEEASSTADCSFEETFRFASPVLKSDDPKGPFNFLNGLALTGKCVAIGEAYYRSFIKSLELKLGTRNASVGTPTDLLMGLATKSVTPPASYDNNGNPTKVLSSLNSLSLTQNTFSNDGTAQEFIKSIDSIDIEPGTGGTPDGEFEVVLVSQSTPGTPKNVPVFEHVSDECGCYVVKAAGQLKLSTVTKTQTTNTYQITNSPSTLKIKGTKGKITPGYTPTDGKAVFGTIDAQPKKGYTKVILEAQKAQYFPITADQDLTLNGKKEMVNYQDYQTQFKVDATTAKVTQYDRVYEYKGKKLYIKGQEQYLNSSKSVVTFQPKLYTIVSSTVNAQLYTRTDTIHLRNGKKLTITPEAHVVLFEYQRMYNIKRTSVYLKWDTDQVKLTPEEALLQLKEEYDVTIENKDIKEVHIEELKNLKLVPKDYTLERYLHDLEFTAQNLKVNTTNSSLESTECQTVSVVTGGTASSDFDIQSGTVNPSETPVKDTIHTMEMKDVSTEEIDYRYNASKLKVEANKTAEPDSKYINGTKLEQGTPPTPPPTLNKTFADVVNVDTDPDDEYIIKGSEIKLEPLDDDYINLESFKLTTTTPNNPDTYPVESSSVTVSDPVPEPPQRMDMLEVKYEDDPDGDLANDVTSTQLTVEAGDPILGSYKNGCTTSKVSFTNEDDIAEEKVTIIDQYSACTPIEGTVDIEFDLDTHSVDFSGPDTKTIDFTGPNIPGVAVVSADPLDGSGVGPNTKSIELIGSAGPETVTEATVEYVESTGESNNLYIPQLGKCPITDDTIHVLDDAESGTSTVSINSTANTLCLLTKIPFKAYKVTCGVLSDTAGTSNYSFDHCFNIQPYWTHTLQVCNASGQSVPITVMTTTDPSTASGVTTPPVGYTILSGSSP